VPTNTRSSSSATASRAATRLRGARCRRSSGLGRRTPVQGRSSRCKRSSRLRSSGVTPSARAARARARSSAARHQRPRRVSEPPAGGEEPPTSTYPPGQAASERRALAIGARPRGRPGRARPGQVVERWNHRRSGGSFFGEGESPLQVSRASASLRILLMPARRLASMARGALRRVPRPSGLGPHGSSASASARPRSIRAVARASAHSPARLGLRCARRSMWARGGQSGRCIAAAICSAAMPGISRVADSQTDASSSRRRPPGKAPRLVHSG
jgi:hypothetical protein